MPTPKLLFPTALIAATALPVSAATYIVDNQHPKAADTNPGTREAPLKTITAATRKVAAGDEILVSPGIYREAVVLTASGEPGKPIVLRSEVPRAAVICGSDPLTEWKNEGPGVWSAAFPGLAFNKYGNGEWVYIDGYPLQAADSRGLLAPGSFYLDFDAQRIFVAPEEGLDIHRLKVDFAHRQGLVRSSPAPRKPEGGLSEPAKSLDDIHLIGFSILHNADWFRGSRPLTITGNRWLVENNRIAWSSYGGINVTRSNSSIIRNNLVEWCGDACIGGGSNYNMRVENNQFLYGNWRRIRPAFEGGISKWVNTHDSIIRGNEAAYFYGYGLWMDIANSGNIFEENVVHDSTAGAGLFTEISWGDVFRHNIAFNNDTGITIGESPNSSALRNICFNNGIGIRMRGDFRRATPKPELRMEEARKFVAGLSEISGLPPARAAQLEAQYLLAWTAPKAHLSNNSLIWDNVLFDNGVNYWEHRNYGQASATDPFINNFSDYNLFWNANADNNVRHSNGGYGDLAGWKKASGRDANSQLANPRDPGTKLPEWAHSKRAYWEGVVRSPQVLKEMKLGLVESPPAALLMARLTRSPELKMIPVSDNRVKACLFDLEGQKTLAIWTSQVSDRRYVRFKTGTNSVVLENGFGGKQPARATPGGMVEVVAKAVPTYLRGVGENIVQVPASTLTAQGFNVPNQPVPVTAQLVNNSSRAQKVSAVFSTSPGFTAKPAQISRQLKPGETAEVQVQLQPDGKFARGTALARMEAKLGEETIIRTAAFAVGEGGATVMNASQPMRINADLDDWRGILDQTQIGVINEPAQIVNGEATTWKGAEDASARFNVVWRRDALYLSAVVMDDQIVPAPSGGVAWDGDCVEFFIDGRASEMQFEKEVTEGVIQVGVSPSGGTPIVSSIAKTPLTGLEASTSRRPNGYVVELKIPLTPENFPAGDWKAGRSIKMAVNLNDKDDPKGSREHVLSWSSSPGGMNFRDTSGWKTLVLD